jgi:multiple sugar transport system permease protein
MAGFDDAHVGQERGRGRGRWAGADAWPAMLLLSPFLLAFALFLAWPALQTAYMSLTESSLTRTGDFVGLDNFAELVRDEAFWQSLGATVWFAVLTVVPNTVLGLVMALLVHGRRRGKSVLQAIFFLPFVLPVSVMTLITAWILHPTFGLANALLGGERAWLTDVNWAMPSVAIATIWWTVGFPMLMFLAGLNNIPAELYEAAELDGARGLQLFRYVTWPALQPVLATVMMLQLINSLKIFSQPYILTGGGPFNTTRVTLHYMYETAFVYGNAGYAAAIAMAFLLMVLALSALQAVLMAWRAGRRVA